MKQMLTPGEWTHQINTTGCHYMRLNHTCKITGKGCAQWCHGEECDNFALNGTIVRFSSIDKRLRDLIDEANGHMLFVENDDSRFSDEDLNRIMNDIVLTHPQLGPYVEIDKSRAGDYLIAIYGGIERVLDRSITPCSKAGA